MGTRGCRLAPQAGARVERDPVDDTPAPPAEDRPSPTSHSWEDTCECYHCRSNPPTSPPPPTLPTSYHGCQCLCLAKTTQQTKITKPKFPAELLHDIMQKIDIIQKEVPSFGTAISLSRLQIAKRVHHHPHIMVGYTTEQARSGKQHWFRHDVSVWYRNRQRRKYELSWTKWDGTKTPLSIESTSSRQLLVINMNKFK